MEFGRLMALPFRAAESSTIELVCAPSRLIFLLHQSIFRIILMNMNALLEQALKLPIAERIRLADDLYDSVGGSPGSVRLTDHQLEELVRRIEDYENDPGGNFSWEEVRDSALAR